VGTLADILSGYVGFCHCYQHAHWRNSIHRDIASVERYTVIINSNALTRTDTEPQHCSGINAKVSGKHSQGMCIDQILYIETMLQKQEILIIINTNPLAKKDTDPRHRHQCQHIGKTFPRHIHWPNSICRDNASEERNTIIINTNAFTKKDA
jgi:hypothetical protein